MTLLPIEAFFILAGLFVAGVAFRTARDIAHPRRWGGAAFWGLLAAALIFGPYLPPAMVGAGVLAMTILAATKQVDPPRFADEDPARLEETANRLGNRLLHPILLAPTVAVVGGFTFEWVRGGSWALVSPKHVSQVALGLGCVAAFVLAWRNTRERPVAGLTEGGRLLKLLGWTIILPQTLAVLGGIFAKAGVGDVIAGLVAAALPVQHPFVAVLAYCSGMVLFTVLLGNAFAAFPVITLGVGLPFIVKMHGGDPAIMGALGMLSGYCGTLLTPMAANFNIVPVRLLELPDDYAVIRAQVPFAIAIWIFNVAVMYLAVYRF